MKDAVLLAMASLNASAFADGPTEAARTAGTATAPAPAPSSDANRVARDIVASVLRGWRAAPRRSPRGSSPAEQAPQEDRLADDASAA